MDEISDEDDSDFAPVDVDIRAMDDQGAEDLFFSSSSFLHSPDIGADTSFGWDSTPIMSSLTVNAIQRTPSPRSKVAPITSKLEKKYRPRDSGVVLSEDESNSTVPNGAPKFVPPAPRHRYTLGRSESVNLSMPPASTSVSTLGSGSSDPELITPAFGPSTSSAWPLLNSSSSTASSLGMPDVGSVDAFILNTLMRAEQCGERSQSMSADGGSGMRPPGTPQKRVKTAAAFGGTRLWQSAVASKIGFDFGNDEDEDGDEGGCTKGQADKAKAKRNKKMPRKSLPAAFPLLSKASHGYGRAASTEDSDEEIGQHDASPTERKAFYDGLGLGRPSVSRAAGTAWLLRRSSSGAISSATTGRGSISGDGSHGGATGTIQSASQQPHLLHPEPGIHRFVTGWQLPPPRIPPRLSPIKPSLPSHFTLNRTASNSSDASTATMLASPTKRRHSQLQPRGNDMREKRSSLSDLGPTLETYAQPGRFEREFIEIGELGSGEFGKAMKVRRHDTSTSGTSGDITAVKKSKRFEGVRHR
jgi:mitosis inhibitor protein kinase SWE1